MTVGEISDVVVNDVSSLSVLFTSCWHVLLWVSCARYSYLGTGGSTSVVQYNGNGIKHSRGIEKQATDLFWDQVDFTEKNNCLVPHPVNKRNSKCSDLPGG